MNAFTEHHEDSIRFEYSCFDRILLNAVIQPLQQPAVVVGFLQKVRHVPAITPAYLRQVSTDYHHWVERLAREQHVQIVTPPKGVRREDWVAPYFQRLRGPGITVILKTRENARVAVSYPTHSGGHHIELYTRFVWQYYFYVRDRELGRMFLRICPYFPFNARVCINAHEWLAGQLKRQGIQFRQAGNAFLTVSQPTRLQELADQFSATHVLARVRRWLIYLTPFFTPQERRHRGNLHDLFLSQVEYCTNLVFDRRAPLDRLSERLLDLNRTIGRPDKLAIIFGHRITKRYHGQLQTRIDDYHLGNPVIRSEYKWTSIKQYVRDHLLLRTETTTNRTPDLGVPKSIEHLPELRDTMHAINERYLDVQQDVLETYLDRGQLERLRQPTITPNGRRIPGIKLDDPRLLALMQALTQFTHLAGGDRFRTRDLHASTAEALGKSPQTFKLSQLRYDLTKLRAKALVAKIPGTQAYHLTPEGFRICTLFLKLHHRIYCPLAAATLVPIPQDVRLPEHRRAQLDRLYSAIDRDLDKLCAYLGLKQAA